MTCPLPGFAEQFGIENIPFGIASSKSHSSPQAVTRFEDSVIFLADLAKHFSGVHAKVFSQSTLNDFAALGRPVQQSVRKSIQEAIKNGSVPNSSKEEISAVHMHLPLNIGDYTDFSCSPHHNKRAGQALLGQSGKLPPGFFNMPLGYAGRSSSIQVSGTPIRRPRGQFFEYGVEGLQGKRNNVTYGPCREMDYEVEVGVFIGKPIPYGDSVSAADAHEHIFGLVLYNDWSARDIQQFEMIPVGPLNSKHVGTTISAWVVTPDALAPFAIPLKEKKNQIAPYLDYADPKTLSINVEVRSGGEVIGTSNTDVMDWTLEQLVAHQSSAGCGVRTGDLLGWGTVSGPGLHELGCLLEMRCPGETPARGYVEDNETIEMRASCGKGVGFSECVAKLIPAHDTKVWNS